ncbi:zona occludens toxin [Xanthomonas translucens]
MFVFNEGVPRSGKSYDCIKNHVLPGIKRGRHVWARINGLETPECRKAIADYLQLPLEHVEKYLHHVETKDVVETFKARQDKESQRWLIDDHFKDALVIIDEIHEFYVESRQPLDPATENFFALLSQNGGDGVIMTQMFARLHAAVRGRIERKHSFQKLSAFGLDGQCRVTYSHAYAAGKFQKIGSKIFSYDKAIYPLYHGYAVGSTNTEVYKEGSKTVWSLVAVGLVVLLLVGAAGSYFFVGFFKSPEKILGDKAPAQQHAPQTAAPALGVYQEPARGPGAPTGATPAVTAPPDPLKDLSGEQRYVAELSKNGRIRLAMIATVGDEARGWVEWVDTANMTTETLDLRQLRELGYEVTVHAYGVLLKAGDVTYVATAWPRAAPIREPEAKTYNTREAGLVDGGGAGAREVAQSAAAGGEPGQGGSVVVRKATRALGTFPENKPFEVQTSTPATTLEM